MPEEVALARAGPAYGPDYNAATRRVGLCCRCRERIVSHVYSQRLARPEGGVPSGQRLSTHWSGLTLRDLVAFTAPVLISFELHIGGQLFLSELMVLSYLPFLLADPG